MRISGINFILAMKVLFLGLCLACLAILGEILFVFFANLSGNDLQFTSFYAMSMFSFFMGFLPLSKTPNRITDERLSGMQRAFIFAEATLLVAAALLLARFYMTLNETLVKSGLAITTAAYCLSLSLSAAALAWSNLKK